MRDDLTDNEIILRQVNCSLMLQRNLEKKLTQKEIGTQFAENFYGDQNYWSRVSWLMRFILLVFLVIYFSQIYILKGLISLLGPIDNKLNLVIQLKKKLRAFEKTRLYFEKLMDPNDCKPLDESQSDSDTYKATYIDQHLYKYALYVKFSSQVTQLVIDQLLGIVFLWLVFRSPDFFFEQSNSLGSNLHLEKLQSKIHWLLGFPAGFKPNENLGIFMGNLVLNMVSKWNTVTSALVQARLFVHYFAVVGILGLTT